MLEGHVSGTFKALVVDVLRFAMVLSIHRKCGRQEVYSHRRGTIQMRNVEKVFKSNEELSTSGQVTSRRVSHVFASGKMYATERRTANGLYLDLTSMLVSVPKV
jgi:hypothetical protein